ncbi:ParB N-terminal domain-containing protein [Clostridioides difficile]|uniref:ParB/RepB/Spo0J family partition protein n=2 Tax=Clostridioides difficile TaxID=1496 RepID=UPI00146CA9A8|nr:ParB N-terminal domain-containing protein [Clostridioides difficile]MCK3747758.1 ParB N-terminal domain-containing protein [Clostridioides difficile]MCP8397045.1 ParB N-terminal domain-containing protein [Clostridioides difficile]MCP8415771.1 ParB N-terminal domain-containing protein [Clostridioides difficile]MCP8493759.1 ParB N-terminal domain-containing protein [Clostridioides difficile]MCP8680171.1 ParB N-terminal domain-containing protein [Clostridioides difficile]
MAFNMFEAINNRKLENNNENIENEKTEIKSISVYDLVPSKDNFYSVEDIEDLKSSIEMFGVKQSLLVKENKDNKYTIIAGHRRRLAVLKLLEENKENEKFKMMPCMIEKVTGIREKILLITTNSTARELTDFEKMKQAVEMKKLLEELRAEEDIKGKTRDLVAKMLNTSAGQIARLENISKKLMPNLKNEFEKENINVSTAYELSRLEEAEQQSLFEEYQAKGSLSIKDVTEKFENENHGKYEDEIKIEETEEIENIISFPATEIEEGKVFKTVFEILKDMKIRKLAEFICSQCDVSGTFCDYALECNDKSGKGNIDICVRWLKTEVQEIEK